VGLAATRALHYTTFSSEARPKSNKNLGLPFIIDGEKQKRPIELSYS
jgi:hypothetical protein